MKKPQLYSTLILLLLLCFTACNNTPTEAPPAADATLETPPATDASAETPPAVDASVETPVVIEGGVAIEWVEPALEALVRQELGKPEGIIYQEELEYVTSLELFGESHLYINNSGGYFSKPAFATKGIDLHVDDGQGNLYKDGTYEIGGQQYTRGPIYSLADFANFHNLTKLVVHKNCLRDLTGLETLKDLTDLFLWDNDIQDAGALASLRQLGFLVLDYNNIADMSAFNGFDQLSDLYLRGNQISSLNWLAGFSSVKWLRLGYNPITNLDGLENMENLEYLELNDINVPDEDIEWLRGQLPSCDIR